MQMLGELYESVSRKSEALRDAVLSAPEGEVLVRKATNDEKWGPSGSLMLQIADMTQHFQHLPYISKTLWERISERHGGRNWRTVYKSLLLLDYILKNGSEQFVNDARQHSHVLTTLQHFMYVDSEGVDRGISIRERAKLVMDLMHDTKSLREERKKAKANRGKFTTAMSNTSSYSGFGNTTSGFGSGSSYPAYGGGGASRGGGRRGDNVFGDDSDDDLQPVTRNKRVHSTHRAPETVEWEPSFGKRDDDSDDLEPSASSKRPIDDDDDWADFAAPSSQQKSTAVPTAQKSDAKNVPATPQNSVVDLLGGLSLGPSTPQQERLSDNPFSGFASSMGSNASYGSPAGINSSINNSTLFGSNSSANGNPAVISLLDASPSPSVTSSTSSKDLFDFGDLSGGKQQSSKPLAATVSPNAGFNSSSTPMNTPVTSNMPAHSPSYGNAYPPQQYGQQGWGQQPQQGYGQGFQQYPPANY